MSEQGEPRYRPGDRVRVADPVEGSPARRFQGRIGTVELVERGASWVWFGAGPDANAWCVDADLTPVDDPRPDAEGRVEGVRNPGRPTDRAEVGVATVGDVPVVRLSTVDGEDGFAATAEFPLPAARDLVARIEVAIAAASGSPPPAPPQDSPRGPETGDIRENGNG